MRVSLCFRQLRLGGALVAAAACVGSLPAADEADRLQDTVARGLRWYFHWERPFPSGKHLRCTAESFADRCFVYCDPGAETLDLTRSKSGELTVNVIDTTDEERTAALRRFAGFQPVPATGSFLIPVESNILAVYDVDIATSGALMRETRADMQEAIRVYQKGGHQVRCLFPLVSKGDPFYEVYLLDGNRVDSIWRFSIARGVIQGTPRWTYDIRHKNIPVTAQAHVAEPSRWFAELPAPVIR